VRRDLPVFRRCICAPLENADEIEGRSVSWVHSFAGGFIADTAARSAVGFESAGAGFATSVFQCGGGSALVGLGRCAAAELDSRDEVVVISHVLSREPPHGVSTGTFAPL
jgi:hypothetical protein